MLGKIYLDTDIVAMTYFISKLETDLPIHAVPIL